MSSTAFGRVVTEGDVEDAVEATLTLWLPTYVAELERQKGLTLPPIRHFNGVEVDPETAPDDLPMVVRVVDGLAREPERRGAGVFDAWWDLGVGVVVAHKRRDTARRWAQAYTGALKACLMQQRSLGGFAAGMEWTAQDVGQVDWNTAYSVFAGTVGFAVLVENVLDVTAGLIVPPSPDATVPVLTVAVTSTHVTTVPDV